MTVNPTASPYHLSVGGAWMHLEGVAPGVQVTQDRPTSFFKTLGNTVYAQVARSSKRMWGLSFEWADAEASRWLDHAATNRGAVYLLDEILSQINMLPESATSGASSTYVTVDGVPMRAFTAGASVGRLLQAGVEHSLSFTTTHTAGVAIGTYNIGAGSQNIYAPPGTGARRGSVAFTPAVDTSAVFTWSVAGVTSGARLVRGPVDDGGFLEGRNTPCRVLVSDGTPTFKMTYSDALALADSTYVLTEVG